MLIRQVKVPAIDANQSMASDSLTEASCHLDIKSHVSRKKVILPGMGGLEKALLPAVRQERMATEGWQREQTSPLLLHSVSGGLPSISNRRLC